MTTAITLTTLILAGLIEMHSDGSLNMPSEDTIDIMPGLEATLAYEDYAKRYPSTPDLFSDAEIDEANKRYIPDTTEPATGLLGLLAGGYNNPTAAEVDACAKHRARNYRGACLAALQRAHKAHLARKPNGFIICGETGDLVIDLDIWNPMPEAQSSAEEAMQAWTVNAWLAREEIMTVMVKLRGQFIVHPEMRQVG